MYSMTTDPWDHIQDFGNPTHPFIQVVLSDYFRVEILELVDAHVIELID